MSTLNIGAGSQYESLQYESRLTQAEIDKWLFAGAIGMGTLIFGLIGLPVFLYGLYKLNQAINKGLFVRPMLVTLIGYMIIIDAGINTFGWALDLLGNHAFLGRLISIMWGNFFDGGYFWHYNDLATGNLAFGGASAPGEKSYEVTCIGVVFPMRIAAAIGFLQMKRWGHQWLIMTCWMGVVVWVGYVFNMLVYADVRFANVAYPVVGWWMFDIFYITPFVAIPYLHTVNRELFAD